MNEEIYSKSELEQPKFSTLDIQITLNEIRTLKLEIDKWKSLAGELLECLEEHKDVSAVDRGIIRKAREAGL